MLTGSHSTTGLHVTATLQQDRLKIRGLTRTLLMRHPASALAGSASNDTAKTTNAIQHDFIFRLRLGKYILHEQDCVLTTMQTIVKTTLEPMTVLHHRVSRAFASRECHRIAFR